MLLKHSSKDNSLISNGASQQTANRRVSGGITKGGASRNNSIINDYNGFSEYGGSSTHLINFKLKQHQEMSESPKRHGIICSSVLTEKQNFQSRNNITGIAKL